MEPRLRPAPTAASLDVRAVSDVELMAMRAKINSELHRRRLNADRVGKSHRARERVHAHCPVLPTSVEELIARVAEAHGVTPFALLGPSRVRVLARARWEVWSELRARDFSYPRIGLWFGKDHTTVLHGVEQYRAMQAQKVAA